jgi:hypothetical protein
MATVSGLLHGIVLMRVGKMMTRHGHAAAVFDRLKRAAVIGWDIWPWL